MSDTCLNCGGLIMKPGVGYGYAGPVCHCPIDPRSVYQRPSGIKSLQTQSLAGLEKYKRDLHLQELEDKLTKLTEDNRVLREALEEFQIALNEPEFFRDFRKAQEKYREALAKIEGEK